MREILFRAKSADNYPYPSRWEYGIPFEDLFGDYMMRTSERLVEVKKETVGEYTGLTDKNGVRIFEGDLVASDSDMEPLIVKIEDGIFMAERVDRKEWLFIYEVAMWRVVGNIYDNPELLGGGDHATD